MPAGSAAAIPQGRKVTLAVVGDVHSQWTAEDEAALASLGADVAVFVGDVRCRRAAVWPLHRCTPAFAALLHAIAQAA
jgi:hypothetical protein